ncbi:MAG: amidohydrolase [Thermotogota bacterium]
MKKLFKNANIVPITSENFEGDVLIENDKIIEIGKDLSSSDAEVIDLKGKYLLPGFIDAHSHIGIFEEGVGGDYQDGNEMIDPNTAQVRVLDAFNPDDVAIKRALFGGVTTAMVVPGSANPIGGQGLILKFRSLLPDEMVIREPAGLKMALGENPKRVYSAKSKMPATRLGTAAVIRDYFYKVKDYMAEKKNKIDEGKEFTKTDIKMEIGEKVLKKEIPARIHAHRKDDIITAVRISKEFDFDLVIEHGTEGYKIADFLKENNIPVVVGPLLGFRTKLELKDKTFEAIPIINNAGVTAALMCDHPVIHLEDTIIQAGNALRYGATEENLLKMLTINPAKILKLEDKIGSIEKGKDADLVVWSGYPFEYKSIVEQVYIEGKKVY